MVNGNHIYAASSRMIWQARTTLTTLTTLAMRLFDLNKLKIIRTALLTLYSCSCNSTTILQGFPKEKHKNFQISEHNFLLLLFLFAACEAIPAINLLDLCPSGKALEHCETQGRARDFRPKIGDIYWLRGQRQTS